jgi:hypothetical protein
MEGGHVLAKCFYLTQPEKNFPRVPACAECERGRIGATTWHVNDDEEYMAAILGLDIQSQDHPEAKELATGKVMHNLRGKHRKVMDAIIASLRPVDLVNEFGILIPNGAVQFSFHMNCFERVIKRITKALYYLNNRNTILPLDHHVEVVAPRLHPSEVDRLMNKMMQFPKERRLGPYTLGDNEVFSYMSIQIPDDYHHQRYLMWFYRHYYVVADPLRI